MTIYVVAWSDYHAFGVEGAFTAEGQADAFCAECNERDDTCAYRVCPIPLKGAMQDE